MRYLYTTVRCRKCSDIIQSAFRHDFQTCSCGSVHVDGGNQYARILWPDGAMEDWVEILVTGGPVEEKETPELSETNTTHGGCS